MTYYKNKKIFIKMEIFINIIKFNKPTIKAVSEMLPAKFRRLENVVQAQIWQQGDHDKEIFILKR